MQANKGNNKIEITIHRKVMQNLVNFENFLKQF